jgi:hypothetical protein
LSFIIDFEILFIPQNTLKPWTMAVDNQEVEKLKANLSTSSEVLTPDSDSYAESIKRWSSAAEKPAVNYPSKHGENSTPLRLSN